MDASKLQNYFPELKNSVFYETKWNGKALEHNVAKNQIQNYTNKKTSSNFVISSFRDNENGLYKERKDTWNKSISPSGSSKYSNKIIQRKSPEVRFELSPSLNSGPQDNTNTDKTGSYFKTEDINRNNKNHNYSKNINKNNARQAVSVDNITNDKRPIQRFQPQNIKIRRKTVTTMRVPNKCLTHNEWYSNLPQINFKDIKSVNSITLPNNTSKNTTSERSNKIYWSKETVSSVWEKLKKVKDKVIWKKYSDYDAIIKKITSGKEKEALQELTSPSFLWFYRNKDALFREDVFMEVMVENMKFEWIIELIKYEYYKFDYKYIFQYISNILTCWADDSNNSMASKSNNANSEKVNSSLFNMNSNGSQKNSNLNIMNRNKIAIGSSAKYFIEKNNRHNSIRTVRFTGLTYDEKNQRILKGWIEYGWFDKDNDSWLRIIGWFLAAFDYIDIFKYFISLPCTEKWYINDWKQFNNFENRFDIKNYAKVHDEFINVINNCWTNSLEKLAIWFCEFNPSLEEMGCGEIPQLAAKLENMDLLQYLWEKDYKEAHVTKNNMKRPETCHTPKIQKNSKFCPTPKKEKPSKFKSDKVKPNPKISWGDLPKQKRKNLKYTPNFNINEIIKILCSKYSDSSWKSKEVNTNLTKILSWKSIGTDPNFIDALFWYNCFEQISICISTWNQDLFAKPEYFKAVIFKKQTELTLFYLQRRDLRQVLSEHSVQEFIVKEYTCCGDKWYYAAEMWKYIYKNQWKGELTRELCKNIIKTIKTKDILNCHSSILTCWLLCEFLSRIKEISIIHVSSCEKVTNELIEYCKNIQESNKKESYISYLMKQKDTSNRSAFEIASENSFYSLLETPEIGTVVKKMWNGNWSNNGLFTASSIIRYLFDSFDKKANDPFISYDSWDTSKVYFFQLQVWIDSSSLRFFQNGISASIWVAIYNWFIYLINVQGKLTNSYNEYGCDLKTWWTMYLFFTTSFVLDILIKTIFYLKAERAIKFEVWVYLDIVWFILSWCILIDCKWWSGQYNEENWGETVNNILMNIHLPFIKEFTVGWDKFIFDVTFLFRVIVWAWNDWLVWIRVCGIWLIYKEMGPVIRMILSMAIWLLKYIVVIAIFLSCCAGVFTAIFHNYSKQFIDFSTSITTWFGGFLNNFDVWGFEDNTKIIGSVLFIAYACIVGVLWVNLLIAVLSNVYEQMAKVVDASHRSVWIQYYRNNKWDDKYGYLIFLASPWSMINFVVIWLESCFSHNPEFWKKFNQHATTFYYALFYFPIILWGWILSSMISLPFCYIKGILKMIVYQKDLKILLIVKTMRVFSWIFGGWFFLLFIYFRDIFFAMCHILDTVKKKQSDLKRIKQNLMSKDVIIFLKFIHSKIKTKDKKDLHSLFMAYLDFEASEKSQVNDTLQKNQNYWNQWKKAINYTLSKQKRNSRTIPQLLNKENLVSPKKWLFYNNKEIGNKASTKYTSYIRKNLIIIEILENYVIEDENGNSIVDWEAMRKLLPLSLNIQNSHFRRWLHSNVHTLHQAMEKLKITKNSFFQFQLLRKIMSTAQRWDKEIDSEIFKIQRGVAYSNHKKKSKHNIMKYNKGWIIKEKHENETKNQTEKIKEMTNYHSVIKDIQGNISDIWKTKDDNYTWISNTTTSNISWGNNTFNCDRSDLGSKFSNGNANENASKVNSSVFEDYFQNAQNKKTSKMNLPLNKAIWATFILKTPWGSEDNMEMGNTTMNNGTSKKYKLY